MMYLCLFAAILLSTPVLYQNSFAQTSTFNFDAEVSEYLATQFTDTIGYTDISLLDNEMMKGVYNSDDANIENQFTIKKGDV